MSFELLGNFALVAILVIISALLGAIVGRNLERIKLGVCPHGNFNFDCPKCFDEYEFETRDVEDCPHGNDPAECDACMRLSDFEFDANRERSFRR